MFTLWILTSANCAKWFVTSSEKLTLKVTVLKYSLSPWVVNLLASMRKIDLPVLCKWILGTDSGYNATTGIVLRQTGQSLSFLLIKS